MNYIHNNEAYTTHKKYTNNELLKLGDNSIVLELGIGNGSSPLMHEFCTSNPKCKVQAFETDSNWFGEISSKYGNLPNYTFNLIDDWKELSKYINRKKYDLVFVDQSPWWARIESINLLKNNTKVFILHDYDYFNKIYNEWVKDTPNNIYINDETSWLGQTFSNEFILEDNYEILPPTLIMRKK